MRAPEEQRDDAAVMPASKPKKPRLAALGLAAAQQSRRPLGSIKDRGELLRTARSKAKTLEAVLKALKEKVDQAERRDEREQDQNARVRRQGEELEELRARCSLCPPFRSPASCPPPPCRSPA